MELIQLVRIFHKHILVIIIIPVLCAIAALLASVYIIKPVYESSATLYLNNNNSIQEISNVYDSLLANQMLIQDYKYLIKSDTVLDSVIKNLGVKGITTEELSKRISVSQKGDTRIIMIKAAASTPEGAKILADEVTKVFAEKVTSVLKMENISIFDNAKEPDKPVSPRYLLNTAAAFISGLALTMGVIMIIELMTDTIRTIDDVETELQLKVVGTVPVLDID